METFKKRVRDLEEEVAFYIDANRYRPARIVVGIFIEEVFGGFIPKITEQLRTDWKNTIGSDSFEKFNILNPQQWFIDYTKFYAKHHKINKSKLKDYSNHAFKNFGYWGNVQYLFQERNTFAHHQSDPLRLSSDNRAFRYELEKFLEILNRLIVLPTSKIVESFINSLDLYIRKKGAVRDTYPIRLFIGYTRKLKNFKFQKNSRIFEEINEKLNNHFDLGMTSPSKELDQILNKILESRRKWDFENSRNSLKKLSNQLKPIFIKYKHLDAYEEFMNWDKALEVIINNEMRQVDETFILKVSVDEVNGNPSIRSVFLFRRDFMNFTRIFHEKNFLVELNDSLTGTFAYDILIINKLVHEILQTESIHVNNSVILVIECEEFCKKDNDSNFHALFNWGDLKYKRRIPLYKQFRGVFTFFVPDGDDLLVQDTYPKILKDICDTCVYNPPLQGEYPQGAWVLNKMEQDYLLKLKDDYDKDIPYVFYYQSEEKIPFFDNKSFYFDELVEFLHENNTAQPANQQITCLIQDDDLVCSL